MKDCALEDTLIAKGDKFNLLQCLKNKIKKKKMENILYASVVESIMYAQVCTHPDIAYVVGMLGRYLSNPRMILITTKKCYFVDLIIMVLSTFE